MHTPFVRPLAVTCMILLAGCAVRPLERGAMVTDTETIALDQAELARVEFSMGAGELRVRGGANGLVDGSFTYDVPALKPRLDYSSTGTRSDVHIEQPRSAGSAFGDHTYEWSVNLNDNVRMDVIANMGAGETDMDLSTLRLRNVEIHTGVGEVTLNLDGDPKESYDVSVEGGVGQATIYLPDHVNIQATAQGGIGDIDVQGLEKRGNRYVNAGHENDPVTIRVSVQGGVGQINLIVR